MRRFMIRMFFFCLPLLIIAMTALGLAEFAGEGVLYPSYDYLKSTGKVYGPLFDESAYRVYKLRAILANSRYDLLAIGSSRVLQFREEMFTRPFFNAGYTVESISDVELLLNRIPLNKLPELVILGLDQWMFTRHWDTLEYEPDPMRYNHSYLSFSRVLLFCRSILSGETALRAFLSYDHRHFSGMNALKNHSGIRYDGSFYYGKQIAGLLTGTKDVNDFQFSDTKKRIMEGTRRFQHDSRINPLVLPHLKRIITFSNQHGIKLVMILPPFADVIFQEMVESGKYSYVDQIEEYVRSCLQGTKHELHNFSSAASVGSDDSEMIDGFHGGESTYLRMLLELVQRNSAVSSYVNESALETDLASRLNRYLVYP